MDWSGVDYCDVFISCLDSHSDGTHPLQSIYWWASDVMLHFSKSDEETNSSTSQDFSKMAFLGEIVGAIMSKMINNVFFTIMA